MNILIDILHPAHVHFFRGFIRNVTAQGHSVVITTRNKEITNKLLERYGLAYEHISNPATSKFGQMTELLFRWLKLAWIIKRRNIDLAMSISGLCTGLSAWLCRVPNIAFTDTEDAGLSNRLALPFCNCFVTPRYYLHDVGSKHMRYEGLHETAYLKHFDFDAAVEARRAMNLPERYVIVRLVANDALHDEGIRGVPLDALDTLIAELQRFGQIFITSQSPLPEKFSKYRLSVPIEQIHAVLSGALLFVGDSPTMSVESSILGTPAFLLTTRWDRLGNMICLEKEHELLRNFSEVADLLQAIKDIDDPLALKAAWSQRASAYRRAVEDVELLIERVARQLVTGKEVVSAQLT